MAILRWSIRDRLERHSMPEPNSGCVLWFGAVDGHGYASLGMGSRTSGSRRTGKGHRVAYELARGPIPPGLSLDHLCRVPSCINPWHLEAVTHQVNVLRGVGPAAKCAKKTTCPRGHPYDRRTPVGYRWCSICNKARRHP